MIVFGLYLTYLIIFSIKVLFVFDNDFYDAFNGEEGKTGEEHMESLVKTVQNAYKDKSLKNGLGTHINIIASKQRYDGSLSGFDQNDMYEVFQSSSEKDNYDLIAYVRYPGASGYAYMGEICSSSGRRYSVNNGYSADSCYSYQNDDPQYCIENPSARVVLTAEVTYDIAYYHTTIFLYLLIPIHI